jgi:hypothetical protein
MRAFQLAKLGCLAPSFGTKFRRASASFDLFCVPGTKKRVPGTLMGTSVTLISIEFTNGFGGLGMMISNWSSIKPALNDEEAITPVF